MEMNYGNPDSWSQELRDAFWSATAAPTYDEAESSVLSLLRVHAHELAEKAAAEMGGCCNECDAATAVMRGTIDPEVPDGTADAG